MYLLDRIEKKLQQVRKLGLTRHLSTGRGIDFCGNDYLGLSKHPQLLQSWQSATSVGSTGSRLLSGHNKIFDDVEAWLAKRFERPSCLGFNSGYAANTGALSTLIQTHDEVFYDARVHASSHDGLKASGAKLVSFNHNDCSDLHEKLKSSQAKAKWIVVESLYSMDGDIAPLSDYFELARKREAGLIVDEAHATGIFGDQNCGLLEDIGTLPLLVSVHTCGKALGSAGAFVLGPQSVKNLLINTCREFIFSTSLPSIFPRLWRKAFEVIDAEPGLNQTLWRNVKLATACSRKLGVEEVESPIIPVILGDNNKALDAASGMQSLGFDVRAVRFPTVPRDQARLRITISASQTEDQIEMLFTELAEFLDD